MLKRTLNGELFSCCRVGDKYLVFQGLKTYYTDERPVSDQEIEEMERQLLGVRQERDLTLQSLMELGYNF